jgi:DNA-directed RNA polymerase specialized sigma24 family protein
MADVSFALFEVFERGFSIDEIADRLSLPAEWVRERIEAARLCLVLAPATE